MFLYPEKASWTPPPPECSAHSSLAGQGKYVIGLLVLGKCVGLQPKSPSTLLTSSCGKICCCAMN